MQFRHRISFLLFFFASSTIAHSQSWKKVAGLPSAPYFSVEVIGSTLYAGAKDTMYFSKDLGATWTARSLPAGHGWIYAFALFNGNLFVGTDFGIYMTPDEGVTWTSSNLSVKANQFEQWDGNLYAATLGAGMLICSQSGNNWSPFNSGLSISPVGNFIRIIPAGGSMMTFDDFGGGFAHYNKSLQKWTTAKLPISSSSGTEVVDAAMDGNTIYVQITDEKTPLILRSEDTGRSWEWDCTHLQTVGSDGTMWRGYNNTYLFWNSNGSVSWIQERANSSVRLTSWSGKDERFDYGYVFAVREFDRRLFIATVSGIYSKENGSPAVSVNHPQQQSEVLLFPNPAINGDAQIHAHGLTDVKVFDMFGRVVLEEANIKDGQLKFHITSSGIYNVTLWVNDQRITRSLLIP